VPVAHVAREAARKRAVVADVVRLAVELADRDNPIAEVAIAARTQGFPIPSMTRA
jgi:hypothetical protein